MCKFKRRISVLLAVMIISNMDVSTVMATESSVNIVDTVKMTEQQSNAISMLNYIRMLAYEAGTSNSRIYLEELYSALTNNTNPNAVDSQTLDEVLSLLDTLEGYRMTKVKRDRVQYIYEQSQARAIREAIPNPVGLLSLTKAYSRPKKILSVIYMAVDSISSYQSVTAEADMERIRQNWELEDEEAKILNASRKDLFSYMVNMVASYELDGNLSLNEESVADFVKWKNNDNVLRKIQFFESKENIYQAYGPYWLVLAECYYVNKDYDKCVQALKSYEKLNIRIFRQDYELAKTLPMIILAAAEVLSESEYVDFADRYGKVILDNTKDSQWDLKYFVAEIYVDLYNRTNNKEFLSKSKDILINNTNYLTEQQIEMNKVYLNEVKKVPIPDDATKIQKKDIKEYNQSMKEKRKTELPPISEALLLNIDMLYSVAGELDLPEEEKNRIDTLFRNAEGILFLVTPLDNLFSFESKSEEQVDGVCFYGDKIVIPAQIATLTTEIIVEVQDDKKTKFSDWILEEVNREDETDIDTFTAIYKSDEAKKYDYTGKEEITITINPMKESEIQAQTFIFKTNREKVMNVLDNWNWLDDASKWTDSIEFERIYE